MNTEILNILKEAKQQGVKIGVKGDSLTVKSVAPINSELLQKIKEYKPHIIKYIENLRSKNKTSALKKVTPYDRETITKIPLSFGQERLWFVDQLQGTEAYHMPFVLRFEGELEVEILEQAFRSVVSRHEILRTNILSEGGVGYQEIISSEKWTLAKEKVSEDMLEEHLSMYLTTPFDLSTDYKLRACLYDLGSEKYVLAAVFHHIASDGWSEDILMNEFTVMYDALQAGKEANLPELSLQYSDYAVWQRKYLEGEVLNFQLSYWEEKLKDVNNLSLPTDYPRPSEQSTAGDYVSFGLDKELTQLLNALCEKEGVTLFMVLLSAFKVLLSRYSGQEDICVGTPIANRTQSELEGMIGFFVNTLALRDDLSGNPKFTDVLQQVKETTLEGYDYQLVPFEKIVDKVVTTRDMSMTPLFQVMFALQNTGGNDTVEESNETENVSENLAISEYEFDTVSAMFDMTLNATENSQGISLEMIYSTALFNKATIETLLSHYQELLRSIVKDATQPIGNLSMLKKEEETKLVTTFNETSVVYPENKTVVDLFLEQVKNTPEATAVVYEGEELSYKDLDFRSNQLAHYLVENHNLKEGNLVGVVLDRSDWLIVSYLAILKTGAAYVPIDPAYPEDRKEYIFSNSESKLLIDTDFIKEFAETQSEYPENLPAITIDPSDVAYVIYTSGSTGKPKGVLIEHKNLVHLCFWHQSEYSVTSSSKGTLFAGIGFDASVWEIYPYLLTGASLYPVSDNIRYDLNLFTSFLNENVITHAYIPTLLCERFVEEDISLPNITILTGGDTLKLTKATDLRIYNNYGPTETTVVATSCQVAPCDTSMLKPPIGKPIHNTQVYILNSEDQLLPIGAVGELCIGGNGVGRGYLNNGELTREKFVANPFKEGDRIYKTGDLARWLPNGTIEFIGRKDNQIKIRGYRIELGEIEEALSGLAIVSQSCVLAKEDTNGNKRLVGYVVPEGVFNKELIEEELTTSLPDYMVPKLWVELKAMPLTSNGKLDRKGLPEPDISMLSTQEYVAPRTEVEEKLVAIWQELLGVERVGVYDDFFELGGHSLLIIQLIARIQKEGYHIEVKDIFVKPTIAAISDKLLSAGTAYQVPANGITKGIDRITPEMVPLLNFSQEEIDKVVNAIPSGISNIQDIYPLSPLQEGIYFHYLMSDKNEGDPYILPNLLLFTEKEKRADFIEALQFVVNRHDVLRTCILNEGLPEAVQVVLHEAPLSIEEIKTDSSRDIPSQLQEIVESGKQWMDVSKAPLLELKYSDDPDNDSYYLLINNHHLIMDHVGLEKIMEEITTYLLGEKNTLPDPVLYRDFIGHTLHQQSTNDSETYFTELLGDIEEPTYPFNLSDIRGNGTEIIEASIMLPEKLSKEIRSVCTDLGMTPAVLFHAAYGIVVGMSSNRKQALFGSLFSGRLQGALGAADSLGLFINTLPLVFNIEGTVVEYLHQVKLRLGELLPYEQTPLSRVHGLSGISNEVSLFSSLLNYRHSFVSSETEENELEENTSIDPGVELIGNHERTNYPFSLSIDDLGEDFGMTAQMDPSINPERILSYMEVILTQLLEGLNKGITVDSLSILTQEEEAQLLEVFNNNTVAYPQDKTLIDLFKNQVKATPEAIALIYNKEKLTYKKLDELSNQLAHYLITNYKINSENPIGVTLERNEWLIISLLAVLKTGGTYVPIDLAYPEERKEYIIKDSGSIFVIDEVVINSFKENNSRYSVDTLDVEVKSSDLAYIIYTSGSTGKPKGVMIEHRSIINTILSQIEAFSIDSKDNCLQFASPSFDASIWEIGIALLSGSSLCIIEENRKSDIAFFKEFVQQNNITFATLPPAFLQLLEVEDLVGLQTLVTAGEAIPLGVAKDFSAEYKYVNAYGPTETSICATTFNGEIKDIVPIGKPIDNTQIYILSEANNLLPLGVVGELCVGGIGVARGYLNKENLTKEKFIDSPFKEGEKVYKTGDLAKWLPDGNLEFIGRKDNQVKIRGYRIELGEVESALASLTSVHQSCVLAKGEGANKRLVGYVVSEEVFDKEKLQEALKLHIPEYMIPTLWVELEEMPITSNGKIARKLLPAPEGIDFSTREYIAPRNQTEEQLVVIWQELLGIERIGVYDNFFELGGHSLLATRLVSMIRKELEIEVAIRDIFEYTTIASLGLHLLTCSRGTTLPVVIIQDKEGNLPLSFSQERLWFLDQLQGNSIEYHIPIVLRLHGNLDIKAVEESLRTIIDRHQILRTVIYEQEGVGYQKTIPSHEWSLQKVVTSEEADLEKEIGSFISTPFNLSKDYMLRSCLYDLGENKYVLACVLHHISSDGVSGGILMNEFMEVYSALQEGKEAILPELSLQYVDYAIWQRKYFDGEVLENQLSYWEEKLTGVSTLSLPLDYARPAIQNNEGKNLVLELGEELTTTINSLCKQEAVTPFMFMLSAFKLMLSRYSEQNDICVGTPIANRTQFELEGMIGFFVNTLALRSDLSDNPSFKEVLARVKETTLGAYDHQLAPFEKVVDRVVTDRDMSMTPLFQVMFDYQNNEEESGEEQVKANEEEELSISQYENPETTAQFDLTLSVFEEEKNMLLNIGYCTALFKEDTIVRMLKHYKELLLSIVKDTEKSIGNLSMLTQEEETELLEVFNENKVDYPLDKTVVDLFVAQVQKSPKAVAATFKGEELTYKELDERSNQLAHYLVEQGVQADDLVGICIDRGLDMLIGVLAILKSGGAYVPIKPDFPKDRIAYLLEDTGCSLLVTNTTSKEVLSSLTGTVNLVVLEEAVSNSAYPVTALELSYQPNNLAYVIYTSGSTGLPKGAMIEHAGLLNHSLIMIDELKMTNESVVAFTAPFTFDISVWQLLSGLLCGGRIAIYSEDEILDLEAFQSSLSENNISHLQLVPSYVASLLESGEEVVGLSNLAYFLVTGEAATKSLLDKWFSLYPSVPVVNAYGPAEAADDITLHIMNESPSGVVVPIGKPVANMDVYVVDKFDNLCPIGVVGELWTSGIGVGRGYLNREELTKEKFITNPFISEGGRLYKTGDLGRWLPDGTLEFVGRSDDQVKIRGYRIELGEIENALSIVEGVQNSCVLAKQDTIGTNRLVGYIVLEDGFSKANIQETLKTSLPDYMVPSIWVELDEMPLTANGKIDRKSLPEPDLSELSSREYVAPSNDVEEKLVKIWETLLGVNKVGVYDDFFELGGHSLLATRLVSMIRTILKVEISIRDVFQYTTISSLGAHISAQPKGAMLPTIVASERPLRIPLSFSQERLWFLDQLQGTLAYHMPIVLRLEGVIDATILEQSFKKVIARHEVLRTNILSEEGYGYQEVMSVDNWSLAQETIEEESIEESIKEFIAVPFDLSNDYKLRACLYDLGNNKYILACVLHHIANDGWSEDILINEFTTIYSALDSKIEIPLPELNIQYADYAIWQRKYFEGEVLENQLSYWEQKLRGTSVLALPTDYNRPLTQSTEGSSVSLRLNEELSALIKPLCEREGVTPFMFLLTAFKVLLSHYSGQEDICVGTPIANRTQSELEDIIGFFVNTLALRSDLSDNPTFKELLLRVKETTLEGYDNQLAPFEKVVDRVVTTRDMSMTPLFQVMFTLQNEEGTSEDVEETKELLVSQYESDIVNSQFDITFNISEENQDYLLEMIYSTTLFNRSTIERMLSHYQELLVNIIKDIDKTIYKLSMLTQNEEVKLLESFNTNTVDYPLEKTLVDLFTEQVAKTPGSIAVVYENESLTYQELDERSNQLGHYLRAKGVKPDALVGICLERSLEMLIGILGILKSGGAYVPIDPEYPQDRIDYMLSDANMSIVLTVDKVSQEVLGNREGIIAISLDREWSTVASYSSEVLSNVITSENLAYVIYTSGSTGNPKGVMNQHNGIVNRLLWTQSEYQLKSDDTILQKTTFSFDVSVWELLWSSICGSRLVFAKPEGHKDARYLKEIIEAETVTTIHFVPSMLRVFLEEIATGDCSSLRRVICSGEALQVDHVNLFKEKLPNVELHNLYGPTEAAIDVSYWAVPLDEPISKVLIGRPVANTSLHILNEAMNLVPVGVAGELCIGGVQVARGYHNKAALTSERFVASPLKEGGRLYRTGDLARWLPDGTIEYIGRIDNQVKIRGYRIELGEIENILSSVDSVTQCCVLAKEDAIGSKRLVGYVVVEGEFNKDVIQDELKESLPDYMVPALWVQLEEMPLTVNGKLNRKVLPEPDSSMLSTKEYVAPRNETEAQLVAIWQELLGVEKIGVHDDFFELGGHSLLATRMVSLIRKELEKEIAIREVFEYTTIENLSLYVKTLSKGVSLPAIVAEDRPNQIPLSFSQERLWFLDQFEGTLAYHIPTIIRIEGKLDIAVLELALKTIVNRHEVLRTNLYSEEGIGYQEIVSADNWALDREVTTEGSALESKIHTNLTTPFNLSSDYKLRACLYDLGDNKYVLACIFHHIASDGWSEEILTNEFVELYDALKSEREVALTELDLQYADYAIWERKYLDGQVLEAQLSYWENKLTGVSTLALPTDYIRPSVQSMAGANFSLELDEELSKSLKELYQQEGVTSFMFLLSSFKVLLARYSGQDDICVGTPIANRTQYELEGIIGFFANTLALRSDLSGNISFRDLLKRVKETTLAGYDNQLTPFEKVVDRVVTARDVSMTPLFQVMFDYNNDTEKTEGEEVENKGLEDIFIAPYEYSETTAQFDLMFNVNEDESNISLNIVYCTDLFKEATIERMLAHYQELLRSIIVNIEEPINNLSMLTQQEETELLNVFNDTTVDYPLDKTIVDLFTDQVQKSPDAVAAVFEGEELTYQELDERSNQLAHYLVEQGVQPDDLVGICLERGLDMLIGIVAILKSGGAYVPIKPDFPMDRITYIIEDTNCTIVVTDSLNEFVLESLFEEDTINLIALDDDDVLESEYPSEGLELSYSPNNLAYVIYTSGSTGLPKGAMIEHAGLLNHLLIMIDELKMTNESVVAFTAPFTFDISVWQLLSGLLCGGRIAIYSEDEILDLEGFQSSLSENNISHLQLVPSYVASLLESGEEVAGLSNLAYFLVTGEAATKSLLDKWFSLYPSVPVVNAYGPAEAADDITLHIMNESPSGVVVPIGKPVANMDVYVVDKFDNLCPIGVVGELWTSGIGVGRGYLNREELTKEKFITNPFTSEGGRLYKTGDLGRWLPDGTLEFVGRSDDQVKIRGYRIELGEIENALSIVEGVQNSCVLAKQDTIGTNRLVGYVVVEGNFNKERTQEALKASLPDYMVPMIWVELNEMPLTANGKIDRKSLPEPDSSELSTREYVAPRNEDEKQMAAIWEDLLGIEQVGIHDDFFELGGHSLLATRLVSMIRKILKKEVEIANVFEYTVMSDLAAYVATLSSGILLPAITVEERPERIPLSFSQERLWFLDELQGTVAYHMPLVIRLEGGLNPTILEQSFKKVIARHEVLRTNILSEGGAGYQEVMEADAWSLVQEEISEDVLEEHLGIYLTNPFDLATDYKFRACLYDLGNEKYVLAAVIHHIASDGWSENILINEFMEFYSSLESGKEVDLPVLSLQYSDYAIWQRKYLEGEVLDNQLSYWKEKLSGVSALELPTDYARSSVHNTEGANITIELDDKVSASIRPFCEKEGVTSFMFLLSAFKVLLSRYSGQEDICVGTPIANRTQSELEGMIGFFVNTLALRSDVNDNVSFRELLTQIKQTTLKSYDNQLAPFERVVDSVVTTRDMSTTPLFQVMFSLENTSSFSDEPKEVESKENVEVDMGNVVIAPYDSGAVTSQFDLTLNISEEDENYSLEIVYNTSLFKQSTIDRMLVHYQTLLSNIVRDASQSIGSLSMLPLEEENQLLNVFNDTSFEYRKDKSVVDLFQDQVSKTPDSVALSFEGSVLTYQELEARSNELACYLASKGIAANTHVGILFNRSFDMVISMLGILKLGCAYVPLDPSLPINRISHIIEDSSITHVVYKEASLVSIIPDSLAIESLNIDDSKGYEVLEKDIERPLTSVSYVMYTSGTTGVPKGISINDENIITLINNPSSAIAINSSDRVLQWSNYAFDGCTYEIFGSLLNGATLYLIPKEVASDASALSEVIAKEELSVIFITTALFNGLSEYDVSLLSSLRLLLFGGEKVSVSPVRKMLSGLGPNKILHVYGPTETTTYASCQVISEIASEAVTIPIGKPLSNTGFYVLNSSKELVPIGAIGELYISGSGVSQGYLNREELTAERFIANPFKEGERIYQTGDLVRWLPEGVIEFVGRKDSQVKIRGYRIELGEIENVLSEVPGIQGSCVIAKEDGVGNKRLVGYVVSEEGLETESIELALKASLPDYMIPSLWIPLESLPLTSNGKLDKKALPEVDITGLSSAEYVAPRNEEEEQLAAIWQELLGVEKVGVHDDFFELGGHSLLVIKLVARINEVFNFNINIVNVFEYPTIAGFLENRSSKKQTFDTNILAALQDKGTQKPIFLAPPGGGFYNCYIDLVKQLGEDQPVYAFQCPGVDGKLPIAESIEAMASTFITELQKVDSKGPYRLGGYSFGGVVAYEMALQLRAKGFEVEELIMFDSSLLDTHTREIEDEDALFREFLLEQMEDLLGEDFNKSIFKLKGKTKAEQLDIVYSLAKEIEAEAIEAEIKGFFEVAFTNENYQYFIRDEEKLDAKIILFKAMYMPSEDNKEEVVPNTEYDAYDYDWNRYTNKEVTIHLIPGTHIDILEPQHLEKISECIMNRQEAIS
ncbi:non-ribosomal peptide synthase/polyketide synthase [Tenacibaculum sp. 190524A02b]|uniref:non-ribosomal peptide synthase/polyketide synthase n=1 Tax=Tenacibaculum vairaonense TaxID=3137860 RepID=UPI0031FB3A02